jgi:apolipoprotein N-acyltransferase
VAVATLLALTGAANRWGPGLLAWLAPVGVLLLARRAEGRAQWGALVGVVYLGTTLQVAKIITAPLPFALAPLFAFPGATLTLLGALAYRWLWRRAGATVALYGAGALAALSDWVTARHSELGSWGTAANTQLENLPLLQLAALVGVPGIAFTMGLVEGALVEVLDDQTWVTRWRHVAFAAMVYVAAQAWGAARLQQPAVGPTVRVAAVITELGLGPAGVPDAETLAANEAALFARTRLAAERGAQLVAWNEAATFVESADEARLVARGQTEAKALGVDLVLAYGAVRSRAPLLLDNRYVWISSEGAVLETYAKHHPVPGEPSVRGDAPLQLLGRPWGQAAGAICYDYDFPAMAQAHARLGAGLVVVPSSDWLGIDPVHTQVTRVRAIEGGFSVLRPTRWATSAAYDAWGRTRGAMSAWEQNDRVLLATLPTTPVPTLYAALGDAPVGLLTSLILLTGLVRGLRAQPRAPSRPIAGAKRERRAAGLPTTGPSRPAGPR